jgi:acyl dehydratase
MADRAVTEFVAIDDPPEIAAANPIHAEGAKAYGYDRPIVAGLSSYGWAAAALVEVLGEGWLDRGWASFRLPRPVFTGDRLVTTATLTGDGRCTFEQCNDDGKATVVGEAGLGLAPFHGEWRLPSRRDPVPPAGRTPLLLPDAAPVGEDYPPMAVDFSVEAARRWSAGRLGDPQPRYVDGDHPRAHPSWVPGQMTPLIRHSYRFAAGIHTTGRVQYLAPLQAPQTVVVAGRWIANEERKGRWWSTSDAVFLGAGGAEVAYCRQEQILLPPLPR